MQRRVHMLHASGERFSIFEDLGPGSTARHLDQDGAATTAKVVRRDISAACDMVVLSKFGRLEAAGKGALAGIHGGD